MNEGSSLGTRADIMAMFYDRLNNYHKRPLHPGQIKVAKDYFVHKKSVIMSQWGRSGGKTEDLLYIAHVAAALNDGFLIYIITPEKLQGKEIYWASKRLQDYPPQEFIADLNKTDTRVTYKNGSSICVDGAENFPSHRGRKPHLVFYDEFQDHCKEFHLEVMAPNLLAKNSSLIIYGTPPKRRSAYYVEFREQLLKQIKEGDKTCSYYEFQTSINPMIDKEKLAKTRKELIESSNEVIWQREYEGKLVFGGQDAVFPKWNLNGRHVRAHNVTMSFIGKDKSKLRWYTIFDPGTTTCFAVLFIVHNPFTQQVFVLDEIYERDRGRTDSKQIWERALKKEQELYPNAPSGTWKRYYDEAAAWFHREICANYKGQMINLSPSRKFHNVKDDVVSMVRIMMAQDNALIVSKRCEWFAWEIESYVTDEDGKLPDANDHLLDTFFYFMHFSNWKLLEKVDRSLDVEVRPDKPMQIEPEDWANQALDDSLHIRSVYDEYF